MNFVTAATFILVAYAIGNADARFDDKAPLGALLAVVVYLLARRLDTLEERDPHDPEGILPTDDVEDRP